MSNDSKMAPLYHNGINCFAPSIPPGTAQKPMLFNGLLSFLNTGIISRGKPLGIISLISISC